MIKKASRVSFATKLKAMGVGALLAIIFYAAMGVLFFVLLVSSGYAPHLGLMGITSLIAAFGLFTKRFWTKWLIVSYSFAATVFAAFTFYGVLGADWLLSFSLIAFALLTWIFTLYVLLSAQKFQT